MLRCRPVPCVFFWDWEASQVRMHGNYLRFASRFVRQALLVLLLSHSITVMVSGLHASGARFMWLLLLRGELEAAGPFRRRSPPPHHAGSSEYKQEILAYIYCNNLCTSGEGFIKRASKSRISSREKIGNKEATYLCAISKLVFICVSKEWNQFPAGSHCTHRGLVA